MCSMTIRDRMPLELCLEAVIHHEVSPNAVVRREDLEATVLRSLNAANRLEAMDYFAQTVNMLVARGLLKRRHLGPGQLGYEPTPRWDEKEAVLSDVLPPRSKIRESRNARRRAETAERKRARRELRERQMREAAELRQQLRKRSIKD
jgi:hypothetical protein